MSSDQSRLSGVSWAVREGFADGRRAVSFLDSLAELLGTPVDQERLRLARVLGRSADPDRAVLAAVRLAESEPEALRGLLGAAASGSPGQARGADGLPGAGERLVAVLGASRAMGDHLARHTEQLETLERGTLPTAEECLQVVVEAVEEALGAGESPDDALRVAYRRGLLRIAAVDLTAPEPAELLPEVAAALSDLAAAALEAAVTIAAHEVEGAEGVRLAVIGMGKAGGRELNYVSDVDVIFVAEPVRGVPEAEALEIGARMATRVMSACGSSTAEGTLWPVDAALRPEGKAGPLVRTLGSFRSYYERWASPWEFQALLKARPVAGDCSLGEQFVEIVTPMVWEVAARDGFVEGVQAMRRRVEEHIPPAERGRQLKLGPGGLRDIEFSVQLLQLVHGRVDESLRHAATLPGLEALAAGGYVARTDAAVLGEAYRLLRCLEHRIQLDRLRRNHLLPEEDEDLRRLGRSMGWPGDAAQAVRQRWAEVGKEVRRLHERLFYRPLLVALSDLSPGEARMRPAAVEERLAALGFKDPAGAVRHLEALTRGVTRTAAIQRQLLPGMLGWLAGWPAPDAGLLAFRRISESLGGTHWYMAMLRDEGHAAERFAHVLSGSRYLTELLESGPEAVRLLGEDPRSRPAEREVLVRRMRAAVQRGADLPAGARSARVLRRTEILRVGIGRLTGNLDLVASAAGLTRTAEALLEATLARALGGESTGVCLIGMGRLGGAELGFASDADLFVVHDDAPGRAEAAAAALKALRQALVGGAEPGLEVDVDLRPEGRNGPTVRGIGSLEAYYERWSSPWEAQALVRARPVAGDPALGARVMALVDPLRWPEGGLTPAALREMRMLKARMETERIPRGADPRLHLKLGRGGLSDVEWTVQLWQMQHAHRCPDLRTTSTLGALAVLEDEGLVAAGEVESLRAAWLLASELRDAAMLWRGRPVDAVPADPLDREGVARALGRPEGSGHALVEEYLRTSRLARLVVERLFYGE
ncbi:glutamate-ammonia-ligase adenylyltransferase [Kytococcus aerolatus]|uniref:Glutamate-ammonia-ligase adenylyltransferase n=1 Tax=Kytococcus aerolatus TaxID=592308 RepID=A0A212U320_9MICO|nr:bifunctional [glutamine synthetase] adenylyltransferase/[glutamine synthetase]-adenylyl-L-tyrosine phosphorylase [Kytococcus aerolatus]SNC72511.1 glutamate-ammonia-ligase adenylyltransferase [Kytococcus aerolatus]